MHIVRRLCLMAAVVCLLPLSAAAQAVPDCPRVVDQPGWEGVNSDIGLFMANILTAWGVGIMRVVVWLANAHFWIRCICGRLLCSDEPLEQCAWHYGSAFCFSGIDMVSRFIL
jgi:hypothetical protein